MLSFVNQCVRRLTHACGLPPFLRKPLTPEESKLWVTALMAAQLESIASWPWVAVLQWMGFFAIVLGWVFAGYTITLAYIIFATLIYTLKFVAKLHWLVTSAIFFLFGEFMFLNPAIPGPAVYLTGGVLLVPVMVDAAEPTADIVGPLLWATTLCYAMKLIAHIGQQKIFGEGFGSRVSVRAIVSPNSTSMRAIRWVLEQRGLSLGKVISV